ncbi:MAG: hypothetical protein ACQEU4_12815 [Bacillota bacterium]
MAKATLKACKALYQMVLHAFNKIIYMIGDDNNPSEGVFHSYTYNQFENELLFQHKPNE